MKNWYCHNCHSVNYDCHMKKEVVTDPFCTGDSPDEIIVRCYTCNSDAVEEAVMCETCGEGVAEEGYDDCYGCIKAEDHRTDIDYCY